MRFGGYRTVWVIALFDLPTDTKEARSDYRQFRSFLLDDGFVMLQYSVYARHCASEENAAVHQKRIRAAVPPDGEVRILLMTDRQFGRMEIYCGAIRQPVEPAPRQVTMF